MKRILILCTGNACRSQMAEGLLKSFDPDLAVFSAGTHPAGIVHPDAVTVMKERGIDISGQQSKSVDRFTGESFDFVITVCDHARDACPVFPGGVGKKIHVGFEDPGLAVGTRDEILAVFRDVRDRMERKFRELYETEMKPGRRNS